MASAPAPNTKQACTPPPDSLPHEVLLHAFLFLDGPADVVRASAANHRWGELARDDSTWRVKARREGILKKARMFEVPLPSAAGDDASAASSSSGGGGGGGGAAEDKEDEALLGVGVAFYAQVFVLKVWVRAVIVLRLARSHFCRPLATRRCRPLGRGTR